MSLLKDYMGILASADNPTPTGQISSFVALNGSKIQVEFGIIRSRLKRRIIEAVARERYGEEAVRIIRLLLDTGKMEEKQVSVYHCKRLGLNFTMRYSPCRSRKWG